MQYMFFLLEMTFCLVLTESQYTYFWPFPHKPTQKNNFYKRIVIQKTNLWLPGGKWGEEINWKIGINIYTVCVCMCESNQSCPIFSDPTDCSPPGSSVHKDSPGKNTGVGCCALLQGIFPTQGSNPGLSYCRQILYQLSY